MRGKLTFISYAREDSDAARRFDTCLRAQSGAVASRPPSPTERTHSVEALTQAASVTFMFLVRFFNWDYPGAAVWEMAVV
jgi:hypothetical protein